MPNLRKMQITIDFNENFVGHLCGVISINQLVNVAGTFTDILKYSCFFLKMNSAKFVKCTLYVVIVVR